MKLEDFTDDENFWYKTVLLSENVHTTGELHATVLADCFEDSLSNIADKRRLHKIITHHDFDDITKRPPTLNITYRCHDLKIAQSGTYRTRRYLPTA